jgi:Recombinase
VYPDRLFLKALVVMIVRRVSRVHGLLAMLDEPTPEMRRLRAPLTDERGRFPSRRTRERRLAAVPAGLPAQIACLGALLMGGIAQWYSDNLSQETKKGKRERKAQGLYNGLLPFGTTLGPEGLPIPDERPLTVDGRETSNLDGLRLAVRLASDGGSDAVVAQALNAAGYRTTSNRGANPFSKDTVAEVLTNRFYWGELPVYEETRGPSGRPMKVQTGWMPGKHAAPPGFGEALWARIEGVRQRNRTGGTKRGRTRAPSRCRACWSATSAAAGSGSWRVGAGSPYSGATRIQKARPCSNSMTRLAVYEEQIGGYLASFAIPADYRARLLAMVSALEPGADEATRQRRQLEGRLARLKDFYELGDKTRDQYTAERDALHRKLAALPRPVAPEAEQLEEMAAMLRDAQAAWTDADQDVRNALAKALFDEIRVLGPDVVAIKPRAALLPFFRLNYELWKEKSPAASSAAGETPSDLKRKRRDSNPRSQLERAARRAGCSRR